jgi:hypothetical protein
LTKKITVLVDDKLDERFRRAVFERKGLHRGSMTQALEEAMLMWIDVPNTSDAKKASDANKDG